MIISGMLECQLPGFGGIKDSPVGCGCHLNTYQLSVWKWNWDCKRLWLYWRHWRFLFHDLRGQIFTCQTRENARTWLRCESKHRKNCNLPALLQVVAEVWMEVEACSDKKRDQMSENNEYMIYKNKLLLPSAYLLIL